MLSVQLFRPFLPHSAATAKPLLRTIYTKRPVREYFVVVWDKKGGRRANPVKCDLIPPHYTFSGEIIDMVVSSTAPTDQPKVRGNAFSCMAESPDEVRTKMLSSVYCQQGLWDMDTVQISALETVHTGDLRSITE